MEPGAEKSEPAGGRVVKRYANRKLYDTRDSRYVTLDQIAELVRAGEDVRIVDNRTKEDLTDVTLAQIIYEEQRGGKQTAWSVRTLRQLVREGGDRLLTSLRESPVARFVHRDAMREEAADEAPPEPDGPGGGDEGGRVAGLVARSREALEELARTADDRVKGAAQSAVGHFRELSAEVRRLQARVQDLEEKLVRATRRGVRKGPPDGDAAG